MKWDVNNFNSESKNFKLNNQQNGLYIPKTDVQEEQVRPLIVKNKGGIYPRELRRKAA